ERVDEIQFTETFGESGKCAGPWLPRDIDAGKRFHHRVGLGDDAVRSAESGRSLGDIHSAHFASPVVEITEQLAVQAAQVGQIERWRLDVDAFEGDGGKLGLGIGKQGVVADVQGIAQGGRAWPAVRIIRYAVLVLHQEAGAARYFLTSSALVGSGCVDPFSATGWVTPSSRWLAAKFSRRCCWYQLRANSGEVAFMQSGPGGAKDANYSVSRLNPRVGVAPAEVGTARRRSTVGAPSSGASRHLPPRRDRGPASGRRVKMRCPLSRWRERVGVRVGVSRSRAS